MPRTQHLIRISPNQPGYRMRMDHDTIEAVQNVIDRVSAYQDGAPADTVVNELRNGIGVAGVELEDSQVTALAAAVEEWPGEVRAADILR